LLLDAADPKEYYNTCPNRGGRFSRQGGRVPGLARGIEKRIMSNGEVPQRLLFSREKENGGEGNLTVVS